MSYVAESLFARYLVACQILGFDDPPLTMERIGEFVKEGVLREGSSEEELRKVCDLPASESSHHEEPMDETPVETKTSMRVLGNFRDLSFVRDMLPDEFTTVNANIMEAVPTSTQIHRILQDACGMLREGLDDFSGDLPAELLLIQTPQYPHGWSVFAGTEPVASECMFSINLLEIYLELLEARLQAVGLAK